MDDRSQGIAVIAPACNLATLPSKSRASAPSAIEMGVRARSDCTSFSIADVCRQSRGEHSDECEVQLPNLDEKCLQLFANILLTR